MVKQDNKTELQLKAEDLDKEIEKIQNLISQPGLKGLTAANSVYYGTMLTNSQQLRKLQKQRKKMGIELEAEGLEIEAMGRQREEKLSEAKAVLRAQQQQALRKMQMEKGGRLGSIKAGFSNALGA